MKKEQSFEEVPMPNRPKWTDEKRREFYIGLHRNFGQWCTWQTKANPFKARDSRSIIFNSYMETWDKLFDVSGRSQLAWMYNISDIGLTAKRKPQRYNQRNMMRNKLMAFDTGFAGEEIFSSELKQIWPITKEKISGPGIAILNLLFSDDDEPDNYSI